MVTRRRFLLGSALCTASCLILGASAPDAAASTVRLLELRDLLSHSQVVLVGTPVLAEGRWELVGRTRRIVTYTRVVVDEVITGKLDSSEIIVRTLGGRVGDIGQIVHGEAVLRKNQPYLLFASSVPQRAPTHFYVTGMAQGQFLIRTDPKQVRRLAAQQSERLERVSPTGTPSARPKVSAAAQLSGLRLADAKALIKKLKLR